VDYEEDIAAEIIYLGGMYVLAQAVFDSQWVEAEYPGQEFTVLFRIFADIHPEQALSTLESSRNIFFGEVPLQVAIRAQIVRSVWHDTPPLPLLRLQGSEHLRSADSAREFVE
jgi:hypothetical protein